MFAAYIAIQLCVNFWCKTKNAGLKYLKKKNSLIISHKRKQYPVMPSTFLQFKNYL